MIKILPKIHRQRDQRRLDLPRAQRCPSYPDSDWPPPPPTGRQREGEGFFCVLAIHTCLKLSKNTKRKNLMKAPQIQPTHWQSWKSCNFHFFNFGENFPSSPKGKTWLISSFENTPVETKRGRSQDGNSCKGRPSCSSFSAGCKAITSCVVW